MYIVIKLFFYLLLLIKECSCCTIAAGLLQLKAGSQGYLVLFLLPFSANMLLTLWSVQAVNECACQQ